MAISFKHGVNAGDLIGSLAGVREVCRNMGQKAIIYQETNRLAEYYIGATHPTTDAQGRQVTMSEAIFKMIKPLITSQDYIEDFQEFKGQEIAINLDVIHTEQIVNIPYLALPTWPMYAFPDMACDITIPWIEVESSPITKGVVIVNMTDRYRNHKINYYFLKKYQDHLCFAGTEKEYETFMEKSEVKMPYLKVDDFLELASCIKGAKFIYGNQSMQWNIAQAMGSPRLLEICSFAPNCQPFVGKYNYGYYHQGGAEYLFNRLFEETK